MLAQGLAARGADVVVQDFQHHWQYAPWMLGRVPAPTGTNVILGNTWNAFAFRRPGAKLVAVQHLFVLDPALAPYTYRIQAAFHQNLVRRFEIATQRSADEIVAVSGYTADTYSRILGVPRPRVILAGVDTDFFTPAGSCQEAPSDRALRVLFVGNMSRRKGADIIPLIMNLLGDGFELSYTAGLRAQDPLPDLAGARNLGRLNHARVRDEYRRADILLLPTRLEGLPLVAMEALACGTPVVATDTASLPEVISHERTGLLCPLDDVRRFAQQIQRLRAEPDLLRRLQHNARSEAQARFSLHRMVDDYLGFFSELIQ